MKKKSLHSLIIFCGVVFLLVSIRFAPAFSSSPKESISVTQILNPKQAEVIGLNLGNTAPDISLKNPDGKIITLSSLRGKLVLLDFWASWCGPCRFESPMVVEAYNTFKNKTFKGGKGFTVFSVSLDTDKSAWEAAIRKDGLLWESHVSDLQGWSNAAAELYQVRSIPTNYLINEKGVIVQLNTHGFDLKTILNKLVINP